VLVEEIGCKDEIAACVWGMCLGHVSACAGLYPAAAVAAWWRRKISVISLLRQIRASKRADEALSATFSPLF